MTTERSNDKAAAAGAIITKTIRDFRVKRWLDGSAQKADRITLAELEACGYRVVPRDAA